MSSSDRIFLSVPGALEFRDVAVRVVGAACKLLGPRSGSSPELAAAPGHEALHGHAAVPPHPMVGHTGAQAGAELVDPFSMAVLSAFSEAFNNLALHGYRGVPRGTIDIEVLRVGTSVDGALHIRLVDTGRVFDPSQYVEPPEELPERGMGLFIMRGFLDELRYEAGPPNVLTLVKRW